MLQVRALIRDNKADEAKQLFFEEVYSKEEDNLHASIADLDALLRAIRAAASEEALAAAMRLGRDAKQASVD